MKKMNMQGTKYGDLLYWTCIRTDSIKCASCPLNSSKHLKKECRKIELVGGKYLCLSPERPIYIKKKSWWRRLIDKLF